MSNDQEYQFAAGFMRGYVAAQTGKWATESLAEFPFDCTIWEKLQDDDDLMESMSQELYEEIEEFIKRKD